MSYQGKAKILMSWESEHSINSDVPTSIIIMISFHIFNITGMWPNNVGNKDSFHLNCIILLIK